MKRYDLQKKSQNGTFRPYHELKGFRSPYNVVVRDKMAHADNNQYGDIHDELILLKELRSRALAGMDKDR